jgi:hypothetical protein
LPTAKRDTNKQIIQVPEPKIRKFKSAKLVGEYEKPWMTDKSYSARERIDRIILGICTLIGCGIAAAICFREWNKLPVFDVSITAILTFNYLWHN